jgi:cysteinyl-tRNA synthetase
MVTVQTPLSLYDTKERRKRNVPSDEKGMVRIYCCGPTVYRDAHVGNLRTFLLADLVVRTLRAHKIQTTLVQNITDVGHMTEDFSEDKLLQSAKEQSRGALEIAREYEGKFHRDLARLNITPAQHYPRASESILLMHEVIATLIDGGYAYQGDDKSVYFSAEAYPSYGAISGNRLSSLKPGHRYEYVEDGAKRFHADWALWKAAGARSEMIWDSPWGPGFPGWHIECSAMSLHYLHQRVDLHIGGIDLRFPHHENERAQSNAAEAVKEHRSPEIEVVDLWLHGEHLLFEGRKMSKSAGNVLLVEDLVTKGIDPLALRLVFLENRYRSQMDLTWDSIIAAEKTLLRWRALAATSDASDSSAYGERFLNELLEYFSDDLNTPAAILALRGMEKDPELEDEQKAAILRRADLLLGLDLSRGKRQLTAELRNLLDRRMEARRTRNFAESDRLRDELRRHGIEVRDTVEGQEWF